MRAAIYARVSTEEQLDGYSIDAQLEACRKLCAERGWAIAAEYVEPGESGKTFAQRPQWQAFMQSARAGAVDVLVCHKIDRFSRSTILDSLHTLQTLKGCGVAFTSATEPIDFASPYGELMLVLCIWFARQYLTNLSAEVTKGRRKRAESGRSNATRPPFGYKRVDGADVPDPATRALAAGAFEQYASGATTDGAIAAWLNDSGARTLDGRVFTAGAVRELLLNPFYCGYVRYRGIREPLSNHRTKRRDTRMIIGLHEPIIPLSLFERAQDVRTARAGKRKGLQSRQHRAYLLQGVAHCAGCGERMGCSFSSSGKRRYSCVAGERGIDCELSGRAVREEVLMPQIERMIASLSIPDKIIARAAEIVSADDHADHAQVRRTEIVGELKRLDYLFQKGRKPQADYDRESARLEAELALLEPTQRATPEESAGELASLIDAWHAAKDDTAARRDILMALLESVEVDPDAGRVTAWKPRGEFEILFRAVTDVGATGLGPSSMTRTRRR